MKQQINLYQNALKQNQGSSDLKRYIYGSVTAFLLLIGFSIYLFLNLNSTKSNLQNAKEQLLEAKTHVEVIKIQYPQQQLNQLLNQEIFRLQSIHHNLSKVVHSLNDTESDRTQGFSRYFSALARQNISELWLTKITINAEKLILTLEGSTYNAEKIPVFIQSLQNESIFQGKNFAKLIITADQETVNQINFTVSTTTEKPEQEDHD